MKPIPRPKTLAADDDDDDRDGNDDCHGFLVIRVQVSMFS